MNVNTSYTAKFIFNQVSVSFDELKIRTISAIFIGIFGPGALRMVNIQTMYKADG